MTLTLPQQTWRTVIQEPIALALAQPHQVLLSTGSIAIMAQFAAHGGIVEPAIGYLIAIGVEWAYLRGLAYNQKAASRWGTALIWVAFLIMLIWGVLWAAYVYGAYSLTPEGSAAWWLAIAHIAPIAAISFCSAMSHQVATRYEQRQAAEHAAWLQTLERQREHEQQALARHHEQQLKQLEIERERRRLDDEQAYRLMKLGEEQRALRAQRRVNQRVNQGATNQATKRVNPLDGVDVVSEVEALGSAAKVAAKYGCSRQAVDKRLRAAKQAG